MTTKKYSVLIDIFEDKFKQWNENLNNNNNNNNKKSNEVKEVEQEDLRYANIMIYGRKKTSKKQRTEIIVICCS